MAQTPYDKADIGVTLDAKGISLGTFVTPLPLPPGEWLVVSKHVSEVKLTGGALDATPELSLGLKSTDSGNTIDMLMVTFTPNSVPITWMSSTCKLLGSNAPFKDDFGTQPSGLTYGCARGFYMNKTARGMVENLGKSGIAINRDLYSGFAPYVTSLSESSVYLTMQFSVDRGRRVTYWLHGRTPSGMVKDNAMDQAIQAWTHETGLAIQSALQNKPVAISAFPSDPASSSTPAQQSRPVSNPVDLTLPGKTLSESIKLDETGPALPLPPGVWKVVGRREVQPDAGASRQRFSRVELLLRNTDPAAPAVVAWLSYDSKPFFSSQASYTCESNSYGIVQTFGSNPDSRIWACGYANARNNSFKKRVLNSETGTEWEKSNLKPLIPYADGLPDGYIWTELRVGATDGRRLNFTMYSAQPKTTFASSKFLPALKSWLSSSKEILEDYLNGKPSVFAPFPAITD